MTQGSTVLSSDFDDPFNDTPVETVRKLDRGWTPQLPKPGSPLRKTTCKPGFGTVHTGHIQLAVGEKAADAEYLASVVDPWLADTKSQWAVILPMSARKR
jgi:hypothetical protein